MEDGTSALEKVVIGDIWRDRPVLVTGATGLVGGWLTKRLLAAGADVVCLVRDSMPQSEVVRSGALDRTKVVRGDIQDRDLIERTLGEYEVSAVFHLAAQTIVGIANRNPISTFESNIAGTWNVLEACRRSPLVKAIVVASSDKAYGSQEQLPYSEATPLAGRHPYDVSKSCADLIAQAYGATYSLPVVITRCGNFYGGGDLNWNRIVPGTIRSILRGQRPVIRSNGKFVRDYFYVEDGAAAYMLIAQYLLAGTKVLCGEAYNLSNEVAVTVADLVSLILKQMGSNLEFEIHNEATNEIERQYLNAGRARQDLGWRPLFTLEEGLTETIRWYNEFFGGLEDDIAGRPSTEAHSRLSG
jgi:CDP-glucose 4,6-dehydratase